MFLQKFVYDYNSLLASRRNDLAGILPPDSSASPQEWLEFRSKKLLRLLPGDEGFIVWCQAKQSFSASVSTVIREAQDSFIEANDEDSANGDDEEGTDGYLAIVNYPSEALVEMVMADFPFDPEEL